MCLVAGGNGGCLRAVEGDRVADVRGCAGVREATCNGEGGGATDAGVVAGGEVGDGGATVNNDATDEESFASPALI